MEWPRLDTGNNSATPCSAPITAASSQLRCADTGGPLVRDPSTHASGVEANHASPRTPGPGAPPVVAGQRPASDSQRPGQSRGSVREKGVGRDAPERERLL